MKEAAELATSTQILMNVSEFTDINQATDSLISSIQAFKYTAEESMDVVDILNTIGNNYAISTADLAQSLTKSSGSLVAANGTLQEAVALTAAANTIIQDADVVGTALKTVAMRLRGTSVTEMEEEGLDTEGAVESKSKLQSKIKSLSGVNILTDAGAYKSTYEILSEIANVWESINDMDQAALLELLAGKRAGSTMAAILENPDVLKDAFESANNAAGSALKENETYLDSIQGKMDLFTNAVQTMWQDTIGSKAVKDIVSLGTVLIKLITGFDVLGVKIGGLIPTLVVLGAVIMKTVKKMTWGEFFGSMGTSITGLNTKLTGLATRLGILKTTSQATHASMRGVTVGMLEEKLAAAGVSAENQRLILSKAGLDAANKNQAISSNATTIAVLKEAVANKSLTAVQAFSTAQKLGLISVTKGLNVANASSIMQLMGVDRQQRLNIISTLGLTMQTKKLTKEEILNAISKAGIVDAAKKEQMANLMLLASQGKLSASLKLLGMQINDFLTKNKLLLAIAAIAVAIWGVVEILDLCITTLKESEEKLSDLNSALDATESKLDDLEGQLKEVQNRIEELNEQPSLTFVEQEELDRLRDQNDELERSIDITNQIRDNQQKAVNNQAIKTAQQYENANFKSGKGVGEYEETGANIGGVVGGIAGGIGAGIGTTALAAKIGGTLGTFLGGPIGTAIGAGIGALIGGLILGGIGSAVGGAVAEGQTQVDEAMDDMLEQRKKLEAEYNKAHEAYAKNPTKKSVIKEYEEAEEALANYDSMMSEHISKLDSYYSSIDLSVYDPVLDKQKIEDLRQEMNDFYDTQDKWAIQNGGADAKYNAINRIFGENADDKLKDVKKRMEEAAEAGKKLSLKEAFEGDDEAFNALKNRLYELDLTIYETEQYFENQHQAALEAINDIETYDAIKEIEKLTGGVNDLKDAFKELHEEGIISAEKLLGLEEAFGDVDGWKEFFDTVSSGTATMEEAEESAQILAENYVDKVLSSGELTGKSYIAILSHLQQLGVSNAKGFLDAKIKKDAIEKVSSGDSNPDDVIKQLEEEYGIKLDGENDRLLIEKAITAEKLKQEASDKRAAQRAYETAVRQKGIAEEKNANIDSKISTVRNNQYNFSDYGVKVDMNARGDRVWYKYNGKNYYTKDELNNAIIADLEATKVDVPNIPAEVTSLDVTTAENAADTAANDLQAELDKHGLTLELDLIGFDEKVDKVQDVYSSLKNIATEYNTQGYLSLDNLQALLQLTPEYLSVLQMENGQITINQQALEGMLQTKLAEAEATAVQTAITQLSALAERKQAIEISNSAVAANQAAIELGTYSSMLGTVAQDAIIAAGSVTAFNNALRGAQDNAFVSDDEINQILSNFNNSVELINSVRDNLPSSFNNILDPGSKTSPEEVAESEWDRLVAKYENQLALITNERDLIEAEIDKAEARGGKASSEYYEDLIRTAAEEKTLLEEQYTALSNYLDANKDTIDQDTWTEYNNTLNDVAVAIKECETNTISWQEALREIDIHYFEEATDELSRLEKELELVDSLLEDEDVADENGNWSSAALTRMAMYTNMIEKAAADTQRYQDEIAKLEEQYKGGELSEEQYQDRLATLTDGLYDSINAQNDARDSIVELNETRIDAIKEGIEKEIEAYEDLIDAKKEELDAERDLYDFRNNIKKQTKDISELERRIASLSGSSAASDVAERRRLEAQLMEAKEGLNDTYYDHSRDAQSSALDDESEAYRESQEKRIEKLEETLDNVELLIQNSMMDVLFNADVVYNELNGIADTYGITLSDELTQPWKDASTQAIAWKDELKLSMTSGEYAALIGEGGAITVFANGVGSKLSGSWNTAKTAVEKYSNFLTGTELGNKFSSTITGFANQIQKIIDKWNGVKTAADNAYQAQLRVQNVGGNPNAGSENNNNGSGYTAYTPPKKWHATATLNTGTKVLTANGVGDTEQQAKNNAMTNMSGVYYDYKIATGTKEDSVPNLWSRNKKDVKTTTSYYAKGTTGTTRDEWAITDEPKFGDELVLVPGKDGNLSFMRKGTGVVPADLTANLMEWGQFTPDAMNLGGGVNINMINNAVNRPEFNLNVDNFLRCDNVSQDSLPELKHFVKEQMDSLVKQMNYSIKRFSR